MMHWRRIFCKNKLKWRKLMYNCRILVRLSKCGLQLGKCGLQLSKSQLRKCRLQLGKCGLQLGRYRTCKKASGIKLLASILDGGKEGPS
ncbi:hypothetical protein DOE73_17520 [Paenibacillus dendritiformis]|nr:hypothetical protein DOE73_17520 [Paenibacillus dendritiformis]